ncbi:MAG: hypothetical protein HYX53_18180 [Chloroflexi bacterium]|nr:hypothetical protein [Chloroflexota bacterium]
MIRRLLLSVAVVSSLLGSALGVLFPVTASRAVASVSVQVYPGGNGYLTCGWHNLCASPYATGAALDFGDPTWVYFRSYASNSGGGTVAGEGHIVYSASGNQCKNWTYVDIYDIAGTYEAEVLYQHVYSGYNGYTFWINGGIYGSTTEYYIAQTATEPVSPTCPTTGKHVMEEGSGGNMSMNTTDYPTAANCGASCSVWKGNWSYWVLSKLWTN